MTSPLLPPGYSRIAYLGRGGTAEVLLAQSDRLRREVALKLPLPEPSAADDIPFAALVERERALIGSSRFPGLVRILDSSVEPPYIAMEICAGPTLDTLGRIDSLPRALNLLCALALDLEYLRAAGLIHGDLKPQNVFLPTNWETLTETDLFWLKLSDFSLGKRADEPDALRVGLGTVGYMPPETITTQTATHRSDLFALGVVAYTVLTGIHPFLDGETDPAVINSRCREEEPPPIDQVRLEANPALANLVSRLLAKRPEDRPATAWNVCLELEKLGATYPFRKALTAVHLIPRGATFDDILVTLPVDWDPCRDYLTTISRHDPIGLRLVLTANTRRDNLAYDGNRFRFKWRPYWPSVLRRRTLHTFARSSYGHRKALIKAAILGAPEAATNSTDSAALLLLPHLLRPATIRKISAVAAPVAETREDHIAATRLSIQAGDLARAERCCYQAATLLQKDHQIKPALTLIDTVLDFALLTDREFDAAKLIRMKGDILKNAGEIDAAHVAYRRVIDLYQGRNPDLLLGKTYNAIGDLFKLKQRFTEGIAALEQALAIYEATSNQLELSHTYNNIGNMYYIAGNRTEALRQYRRALRIQRRLSATAQVASTLNNLGGVMAMTGRLTRAARLLLLSLGLKRTLGDTGEIARTLNNLGYLNHMLGRKDEAIGNLEESLELNRRIGNRKEILFNLDNLAAVTIGDGRLRESLSYLREGSLVCREIDDRVHQAVFSRNTSIVLRRMGRFGPAAEQQQQAEKLLSAVDDREEEIRLQVNAASLRAAMGDTAAALELARTAIALADTLNCKPEKLNALLLFTRLADDPAATEIAHSLAHQLDLTREHLLLDTNRLEHQIAVGNREEIATVLGEVASQILALESDLELPRLLLALAQSYDLLGRTAEARPLVQRALTLAESSGLVPEKVLALTVRCGHLLADSAWEEAFAAGRQALGFLKEMTESIPDPADRTRFQQTPVVQTLVTRIKLLQARIGQKKGAGN